MNLTLDWIDKQISDKDNKLKTIWMERINTLNSVRLVIKLEMRK